MKYRVLIELIYEGTYSTIDVVTTAAHGKYVMGQNYYNEEPISKKIIKVEEISEPTKET